MPRRFQRSRRKGAKLPSAVLYIGRPTRWQHPFKIGPDGDRATVLATFSAMLDAMDPAELAVLLAPLVDKDLACWCKPTEACHADIWLQRANPDGLYACRPHEEQRDGPL
jgi:hypothetical protein